VKFAIFHIHVLRESLLTQRSALPCIRVIESVEVISNPGSVACVTRSMSDKGNGILRCFEAGWGKIIYFVLSELMISRFLADQEQMLSYFCCMSTELCWPTSNAVSSACLMIIFYGDKVCRSEAYTR